MRNRTILLTACVLALGLTSCSKKKPVAPTGVNGHLTGDPTPIPIAVEKPPKVEPIREWHFGKDDVPEMGPASNPETPAQPETVQTDGRSRTDQGSTPGKR